MKSITNRACGDKRRHAPALPNFTALASKVEVARKWLDDFDQYTQAAYSTATDDAHTIERLLQHAAPGAVKTVLQADALDALPFRFELTGGFTSLDEMNARADVCGLELKAALCDGDLDELSPLLRFIGLHVLHAQYTLFADELKEAAWFARGDENAVNETPMFYGLFEKYLEHSGRADELKAAGLISSDILPDAAAIERTPAFFAEIWEETLVRLVDEARDRLAVVTRMLPRYAPPSITKEEEEQDPTLGLIRRHWERESSELYNQLKGEKEAWETWLATPGLEMAYWYAREVDMGLDDCRAVKPALGLVLDHWRREGIAGEEITVDALYDAIFEVKEGEG